MRFANRRDQRLGVEVAQVLADGVPGRAGELEERVDLAPPMPGQGHDRDRAQPL